MVKRYSIQSILGRVRLRSAWPLLLTIGLFFASTSSVVGQCTGAIAGPIQVPAANWLAPTVPAAAPVWPSNFPPGVASYGTPVTSSCAVCPSTFTTPITASNYVQMYLCQGNVYTFSLCTSPAANNFTISITTGGFAAVAAGYFGSTYDDDGCGPVNGPATVTFSPQVNNVYRIRILQDPCVANAGLTGTLVVSCTVPSPPPNDNPCTATALPVGTSCTF